MQVTLNSFKVFQNNTGDTKVTYLSFLRDSIALMIAAMPDVPRPIQDPGTDLPDRLTGRHFPSQKPGVEGSKDPRPTKKCRVCKARGVTTNKGGPMKTVYICRFCPSNPGLHPDKCFELYHTILDYSQ